jgi:hypothetical protein
MTAYLEERNGYRRRDDLVRSVRKRTSVACAASWSRVRKAYIGRRVTTPDVGVRYES